MKKLYTMMMMAMMGMMAMSFTSCETDEEIAKTLEGTWRGDMTIEDYRGMSYVESEITFLKDPYTYSEGTGLWVDYYTDGYYNPTHIEWSVKYGTIYIYFVEDDCEVEIRHYSLTDNHFRGEFYDYNKTVNFDLRYASRRYETDYNWRSYRTRAAEDGGDSLTIDRPRHRIRQKNRLKFGDLLTYQYLCSGFRKKSAAIFYFWMIR